MNIELICMTMLALLIGFAIAFNGYRLFLVLLPIWGFFFGFTLGAETLQAIFGTGFLSTVSSWVVGFIVALIFAVLSYLFYFIGVALFAGSLGYALGAGFMQLIGIDWGFLVWIVGIVVGVIVAAATILLNIQKWVIIVATAMIGAAIVIGSFLFVGGTISPDDLGTNAVRAAIADSWFWLLGFVVLWVLGMLAQAYSNRTYTFEPPPPREI